MWRLGCESFTRQVGLIELRVKEQLLREDEGIGKLRERWVSWLCYMGIGEIASLGPVSCFYSNEGR